MLAMENITTERLSRNPAHSPMRKAIAAISLAAPLKLTRLIITYNCNKPVFVHGGSFPVPCTIGYDYFDAIAKRRRSRSHRAGHAGDDSADYSPPEIGLLQG
jgi:hypothetical protein